MQIGLPTKPAMDMGAVANATRASAAVLESVYPQSELWEITDTWDRSRYSVINALGETKSKVQAVGPAANRLKIGQVVVVGYYDRNRRKPYIKAPGGWAGWGDQTVIGEWQQTEGNFYLSQPGLAPDSMPTVFTDYLAMGSFSTSNLGLARLLGVVVVDGAHVLAYYIGNGGLTAYSKIRFHAYTLGVSYRSPLWTFEITLDPEVAITTERKFRAGLFWDAGARILTACDRQVWSVLVPADINTTPTQYAQTDIDARYCASVAGRYMLLPTATGGNLYRRDNSRQWIQVGTEIAIDHNLVLDIDSSSRSMSRPVPVTLNPMRWHFLADSWSRTPSLTTVTSAGVATTSALTITYPTALELESALALADTEHEINDPPFGPFPDVQELVSDNYGIYQWGGRASSVASGPGGSVYTCPRPGTHASNVGTAEDFAEYQWTGDSESTPPLCEDSTGALIYAAIEPISLVVPNSEQYYTVVYIDTPYSPPGYTDPAGVFQYRGISGIWGVGIHTYYHQPKAGFSHRLIVRKVLSGAVSWTLDLSSGPFSGANWTDYVSVTLTEDLPCPEAAWQVMLGPRTGDDAWQDAIFVVHGRRAAITDHERPALSAISSAGVLQDTITDLAPLDLEMDGSYTWQVTDVRMSVNIGAAAKWALVGVYSENPGLDQRKDIYLINLADLTTLAIEDSWTETNGTDYPRAQDFDHMAFSSAGIFWVGDHAGDPYWIRFE